LQSVSAAALADFFGVVGADGDYLDAALVELVSKLFPSP